ncbi:MAG: N-acetyltransferase [Bacteroidales bacterium]|nr:N-acetyltransferase [Bacteroidales bacterium]
MEIEIREVRSCRERHDFLRFPDRLYKDNPCYVPPLRMDERKIFRKDYVYNDCCETVYYNAYRDGEMVGRISGIIQRASNEKRGEKRVRFTRFDCIRDFEVAKALFAAVESWAVSRGMDTVCGPLGFSDLEREGLLVEGFDQLSTFEEQYNGPWYPEYIERLGYVKEVDWTESKITAPTPEDQAEMQKMADFVMRRYHLKIGPARNVSDFLNRYADGLFEILDKSYDQLYGTVPFTPGMKKLMIDNFKMIISLKYVAVVLDENDKVVLLGVCLPSLAQAVRRSRGRITPRFLWDLLRAKYRPEVIDLGLIGVDPEWLNRGVSVMVAAELGKMLGQSGIRYAETNLNIEDNYAIQNLWRRFGREDHKRRRAYVKKLA